MLLKSLVWFGFLFGGIGGLGGGVGVVFAAVWFLGGPFCFRCYILILIFFYARVCVCECVCVSGVACMGLKIKKKQDISINKNVLSVSIKE